MRPAAKLADHLPTRQHNASWRREHPGHLGSAIGDRYSEALEPGHRLRSIIDPTLIISLIAFFRDILAYLVGFTLLRSVRRRPAS